MVIIIYPYPLSMTTSSKPPSLSQVDQTYGNFRVTKATPIQELQAELIELVHEPTGAQVIHIRNDDPENLFCLSFKTIPESSNGVAHILEHTVLCGSEHFPVKDPFFAMTRRSLNTFMNALTGSDFTCYPAASQVPKDFYNILEVYLDAVFRPKLDPLSFLQEGHRLEFEKPDDPSSPLEYKGIVFNEMKGAMGSPTSRLLEAVNQALFPDITYGFNSGGDPKVIPELTYEELLQFHKSFYHPSHCLFFFYGDMPLEKHLDFIAKNTLDRANKGDPIPAVPLQPRFDETRYVAFSYPIAKGESTENKTMMAFGWLTCHVQKQLEILALDVLETALLDTDASPLKRALLDSELCTTVSSYIDGDNSEAPAVIILKGCNADYADQLEHLLKATLEEIAQEGIDPQLIDNALHQHEFYRYEITGDQSPFGLSLFMRSALLKQHGANPEEGLVIHSLFGALRHKIAKDPHYFQNLIRTYLIDNKHFVRVVMTPDPDLGKQEEAEEQAALEKIKSGLTFQQTREFVDQAKTLEAFQEAQENEDLDALPKVTLADVPKRARDYPLIREHVGEMEVYHHACFTNDIIYADLIFPLPQIPQEDLSTVRLFANLLPQMGSGGRNYVDTLNAIQADTGGLGTSLALNMQAGNHHQFTPSLQIRGKALGHKSEQLFGLLNDMATSVDFTDKGRLREVIRRHYTSLQNSLNNNAMKYAVNLSASHLDVASRIVNDWYGLSYYWKIKELAQSFDKGGDALVDKLQSLKEQVLCLDGHHLVLSCSSDAYTKLSKQKFFALGDLETRAYAAWRSDYPIEEIEAHGRVISTPVAFTAKVFRTVSYTHPDTPALSVAAALFDNVVLHKLIREQGGAYGGGAVNNALSGHFYFYSYRDPNIGSTLDAFDHSISKILEGKFQDSDIEEAKLEIIQGIDSPISPGSRAELAYSWLREGKRHAVRQDFRDRLLGLTRTDVMEAIRQHILPNLDSGKAVVFSGQELLEKENALLSQKLPIHPI